MGTKQTAVKRTLKPEVFDEREYLGRAFSAYYKGASTEDAAIQPGQGASTLETVANRTYVVLRNTHGTLAVYRIRNEGILKRLRKWPKEIDAPARGRRAHHGK
ncbi:MAG: hypothetical protein H0V35_07120 [Nitrospira sp.]|nr:hypothetical protein [Nitrospira sp.]